MLLFAVVCGSVRAGVGSDAVFCGVSRWFTVVCLMFAMVAVVSDFGPAVTPPLRLSWALLPVARGFA